MAELEIVCSGLLFDVDGTLVDSILAVDRAWRNWCISRSLDPAVILPQIHGKRSIDSISLVAPHLDAEAENLVLRGLETTDTDGVVAMPGAIELLNSLPRDRWGIVTSGSSDVAMARLTAAGIPSPPVAVYGEDVSKGKPNPEPYLRGARLLGAPANEVLGFEDTVAGIQSLTSAGCIPVGVGLPFHRSISDFSNITWQTKGEKLIVLLPNKL